MDWTGKDPKGFKIYRKACQRAFDDEDRDIRLFTRDIWCVGALFGHLHVEDWRY